MKWLGEESFMDNGDIKPTLCSFLDGLLTRNESVAAELFHDRRLLEHIVKIIVGTPHDRTSSAFSRPERAACLYVIVLACRLARMDDFAMEQLLPLLITGALSGVTTFGGLNPDLMANTLNFVVGDEQELWQAASTTTARFSCVKELVSHSLVQPLVEDIEDSAQSLREMLERGPETEETEDSCSHHTPATHESAATSRSHRTAATTESPSDSLSTAPQHEEDSSLGKQSARSSTSASSSPTSQFDDPHTCGTFALRRLCVCGLGFVIFPPVMTPTAARSKAVSPSGDKSTGTPSPKSNGTTPEKAKGQSQPLKGYLSSGATSAILETLVTSAYGRFLHPGAAALESFFVGKRCVANVPENEDDSTLPTQPEANASPVASVVAPHDDGAVGTTALMAVTTRQDYGIRSTGKPARKSIPRTVRCLVCTGKLSSTGSACKGSTLSAVARLLLGQVSRADLERTFTTVASAAKRWLRKNRPKKNAGGTGTEILHVKSVCKSVVAGSATECNSGGDGSGSAENGARRCPTCRIIVLGHPLDSIATRCFSDRHRSFPSGTSSVPAVLAGDRRWKDPLTAPVSQALGEDALAFVAERLGSLIRERRRSYDKSLAKLAIAKAEAKEAKQVKLDRSLDFRRRLAAAAREARQEIETNVLGRRLLQSSPATLSERARRPWNGGGIGRDSDGIAEEDEDAGSGNGTIETRFHHLDFQHGTNNTNGDGDNKINDCRESKRSSQVFRDLARGMDAGHQTILNSMQEDGLDTRIYLQARRTAFQTTNNEDTDNETDSCKKNGNKSGANGRHSLDHDDYDSLDDNTPEDSDGVSRSRDPQNDGSSVGSVEKTRVRSPMQRFSADNSDRQTVQNRSRGNDLSASAEKAKGGGRGTAAGDNGPAAARSLEQIKLDRARREAKAERLAMEKREELESERAARRRAKDGAEEARRLRGAKRLAAQELEKKRLALEKLENEQSAARAKEDAARDAATARELKKRSKLRRAREKERRREASAVKGRHDEEMARIARWRKEKEDEEDKQAEAEEIARNAAEALRRSKQEALATEEECRRQEVEAKRLRLKQEKELAAARLRRGEFRYLRGKLHYREAQGTVPTTLKASVTATTPPFALESSSATLC